MFTSIIILRFVQNLSYLNNFKLAISDLHNFLRYENKNIKLIKLLKHAQNFFVWIWKFREMLIAEKFVPPACYICFWSYIKGAQILRDKILYHYA
jgi:hypothetical protein